MKTYEKYLNEAGKLQVGDYIMQDLGGGEYYYGLLLEPQKKGGFKAIVVGDPWPKAVIKSTKNWYPQPIKISENDIPPKYLKKMMAKKQKMGK